MVVWWWIRCMVGEEGIRVVMLGDIVVREDARDEMGYLVCACGAEDGSLLVHCGCVLTTTRIDPQDWHDGETTGELSRGVMSIMRVGGDQRKSVQVSSFRLKHHLASLIYV